MKFSCEEEGVGSMWMCRFVVFVYSSLATLSVVISLGYCLPFSVGATRCSTAVLFRGSFEILAACGSKTRFGFQ